MRKSLKKVIACLLAVLMVTFSVPFSALAASDDYKPNITMRFGTFVEDNEVTDNGGALTSTEWGVKKPTYDAFSGPNGAPLDYEGGVDKETGALKINRLYLENSKVKGVLAYNGVDESAYTGELTGQTDYVQGMPFTMTLTLNNVSTFAALDGHLKWTDNIAPAVVWKSGTTNNNQTGKVGTFADYEADTKSKKTLISEEKSATAETARSVLTQYSCDNYYPGNGMNTESGYANAVKNQIYTGVLADATVVKPSFAPLNTADIDCVTNPKTGETGYNCDNDAILITFLFIVTGEISEANPLEIKIRNPDVSNDWASTETINELSESQQQTYGPRANCPGSTHLFFMGYNKHTKETIGATEHTHTPGAAVRENEVPATCTTDGSYDEVVRCTEDNEIISTEHHVIPATGHKFVDTVVAPTCTAQGYTLHKCSVCGEETKDTYTDALGHKWKATKVVAPTYESQGYTEYVCENDPSHTKKDDYTAKLDGVKLTVNGKYSSYGSVEGYDFDKATWAGKNSTVTLKASPIEGAVFAGWEIDGKVVSTADTLELTMYKDITVTPIFQEEQKSTITVVFLDMYNNVTASYTNMTAADFQAEMAKAIPTPAEYPGYTFAGWSQTDDAIKALDTSATITSSYKTRGNSYTVNAQGANITVNGETKADTFADIAYDTAVTVSADNAKAWAIDGTTVAVGSSYTFYVGSDVTITPVTDAVTDKPMTAIVSAAPATAGSYRVSFLASSYIPAGYTVIDRGFVYGKGATQDELTLEKVGTTIAATGAKVKSISVPTNKDTVNDFGLVYGVKNKDAAATAVAYVTVKSMADDNSVTTVYSTISQFNY